MAKLNLNLPKKRAVTVPASLLKRFGAYLIDFILISIILGPLNNTLTSVLPVEEGFSALYDYVQNNPNVTTTLLIHSIVTGLLIVLYFTYFEYKIQQTPGKLLFKTSIVPDGKTKLTFWHYFLSNISFIPSLPFFILMIIDAIHMVVSPKRQRLMEKIAKILVVES